MDLSSIRSVPIDVPIVHPGTREPTGFVLSVLSPQDPAAAGARRKLQDNFHRKKATSESDLIDFTAALITGWQWNDADWGGQKLPFSPANVRLVLSESWVRAQVDEAIGDQSAFFQK